MQKDKFQVWMEDKDETIIHSGICKEKIMNMISVSKMFLLASITNLT